MYLIVNWSPADAVNAISWLEGISMSVTNLVATENFSDLLMTCYSLWSLLSQLLGAFFCIGSATFAKDRHGFFLRSHLRESVSSTLVTWIQLALIHPKEL